MPGQSRSPRLIREETAKWSPHQLESAIVPLHRRAVLLRASACKRLLAVDTNYHSGLRPRQCLAYGGHKGAEHCDIVALSFHHNNGEFQPGEVLLVFQVTVDSKEDIEFLGRKS